MATAKINSPATEPARHTPYPYYSLQKALEVAEIIRDLGGVNGEVQKSLIAHRMELDENSQSLAGILGAAKLYCLIEGRGAYRLTETAKRYFFPSNDSDRQIARLEMIKGPPLFSALIERFDGTRLPTADILQNILQREHSISDSWRSRVVSLFLTCLREVQAIDAGGFVRYKSSIQGANISSAPIASAERNSVQEKHAAPEPQRDAVNAAGDLDIWSFRIGNQVVRLETSHELSAAAWIKLNQYVQVLKPEGN